VVWYEDNAASPTPRIYEKHWNGSSWQQDGGNISTGTVGSNYSHIITMNNTPYVSYLDSGPGYGPLVLVKHWNGSAWVQDGSWLNFATNYLPNACNIAAANGTPYVCWAEPNGGVARQLYVKHFNGSSWVQDGTGSLNINTSQAPYLPCITISNGTPYVAWNENGGIYVKHFNGSAWVPDGGNLKIGSNPASSPSITAAGGTVFATWREDMTGYGGVYYIYVKHLDGSNWVTDGIQLNNSGGLSDYPSLTIANGIPMVTYCEQPSKSQVYVKHWPFNLFSITPSQGIVGQSIQALVKSSGYIGNPSAKLRRAGYPDISSTSVVHLERQ
jgi:hypothetical protein